MKNNRNNNRAVPLDFNCFKCGGRMKRVTRKNHPFGKNSKPRISNNLVCKSCGYNKMLPKQQERKKQ